ncbi:MAG: outer membrane beta-barrel protein [Muribaculaceae bacterium]|jgi:outer membrane protein W|nr:outer membrane beta-barrel protein [Muribaculaceae bacterium]MEE1338090.1 outer membrane beta-barrel protein [Muribaculaceae bacterium]
MKTINYFKMLMVVVAVFVVSLVATTDIKAQTTYKPYFGNVDWQFNAPFGNDFTNRASGWGANLEGGLFVTTKVGLGLFVSYSTNHKSLPMETLHPTATSTLTAKQSRSLFQIPFGVDVRYRFYERSRVCDPYVGLKIGTSYVQLSSYMSTFRVYDDCWGFYMSPEIGTNLWLNSEKSFGFNMSAYYSFSTNKARVLDGHVNQVNNMGVRVGVAF